MADILRFPKRKSRLELIDELLERVRCERAKAHARWRALDDEVHALYLQRFEIQQAAKK